MPTPPGKSARAAYKDFLTLWKDADPDIPVYRNPNAEYAKLCPDLSAKELNERCEVRRREPRQSARLEQFDYRSSEVAF
jgi:hypothetical protein